MKAWVCDYCEKSFKDKETCAKHEKECDKHGKDTSIEYERKCNRCSKVWHSDPKEEKNLKRGQGLSALAGLSNVFLGSASSGATAQWVHNADSHNKHLGGFKKCPECGSTDYKEKIIRFKRQK
mgnify:CR=1 FL=1